MFDGAGLSGTVLDGIAVNCIQSALRSGDGCRGFEFLLRDSVLVLVSE